MRAELAHGTLPWANAAISGWVLDPDRKKMAKSKGNVVTPLPLIESHGADALRYWAANGRPGTDTAVDEGQVKIGRRLAIKVLNASRFALSRLAGQAVPDSAAIVAPIDRAMIARLATVVADATAALEEYDYARALERTETFFWAFCDDYLELVKTRAYGADDDRDAISARTALAVALSTQLRLFAPFLPFVTEEVWSWWQEGSVHHAPWPVTEELAFAEQAGAADVLEVAAGVLGAVRREKTNAKRSMRAKVARLEVRDSPERLGALAAARRDLCDAGGVDEVEHRQAPQLPVGVPGMRVVGEFDIHRPALAQAILHLAGNLLVGEVGQE